MIALQRSSKPQPERPHSPAPQQRAPDSIQFNLVGGWTDTEVLNFQL